VGSVMLSARSVPVRVMPVSGQRRPGAVHAPVGREDRPTNRAERFPPLVESCPVGQVLDDQNDQINVFLA
jgi:hypothetical protein